MNHSNRKSLQGYSISNPIGKPKTKGITRGMITLGSKLLSTLSLAVTVHDAVA